MLDIASRVSAALPHYPSPEFVRLSLSQSADGRVFASITATSVDPEEPELIDFEVVEGVITSIDDLVALIRAHVRIGEPASLPQQLS
ncbi:hypothetical protein EAS56_17620 [Bradyrhizobium guangzhouense]|uniref:Uncharacterized protein n=1 Tax=Bradyrhizobium guangzhouense TaxID=1325095 RepID=A0ABY0E7X8_9BRAD|nr:hypothetical protein [Bradyrhizobium guangzhouense]RXH12327.1 hypothetical protein EAS56_17620 [Bradyrhizobium guangzhouense]